MQNFAYRLYLTNRFTKQLSKCKRKNSILAQKVLEVLDKILKDPFDNSLRSHKVKSRVFGETWSTRVTGDVRVIWSFGKSDKTIIVALDLGGHKEVY